MTTLIRTITVSLVLMMSAAAHAANYFPPKDQWQTHTPQAEGFDPAKLQAAIDFAVANETRFPPGATAIDSRDLRIVIPLQFAGPYSDPIGPLKPHAPANGLILRHGMGAESLAWTVFFALSPVSCVYYPVTTLPGWLQPVAWAFPQTYVFEGMRTVMFEHVFRMDYFFAAVGLDVVFMAIGIAIFFISFRGARHRGALMQMGE